MVPHRGKNKTHESLVVLLDILFPDYRNLAHAFTRKFSWLAECGEA